MNVLALATKYFRSTFCMLFLISLAGIYSYSKIPVEAMPQIKIPYVAVSAVLDGVSPEDAARLLVRPIEQEVQNLDGVDEIKATASESYAFVIVKFLPGTISVDKAVADVRAAVDRAEPDLPPDTKELMVEEMSSSKFPGITVTLNAAPGVHERTVFKTAKMLKREINSIPLVLETDMLGHREEVVEAVINPSRLEHYGITPSELNNAVVSNNLLVPAGQIDKGFGRFSIKVPGLIERYQDIYGIPVKSTSEGVVTLGEVTDIRRTFKDADRFTTFNGEPAILLEVTKRIEANQIEMSQQVREKVESLADQIPPGITVNYAFDQSNYSLGLVSEMSGNIVTAIALVMIIVVAALGLRSGLLVGLGIPFSLLVSFVSLNYMGSSFNLMAMFGMMLALGMLIDGSIVITEYADRKMADGMGSAQAYQASVKRMFWPVLASTATTLAAFLPLMFWPGFSGDFMRYLPMAVFSVLSASLVYALFFAPVMGSLMGKAKMDDRTVQYLHDLESASPSTLPGFTGRYSRVLKKILSKPGVSFISALVILVVIFVSYGKWNSGAIFFAVTEESYGVVAVRAQGNFSVKEAADIVQEVERRVYNLEGVRSTYSSSGAGAGGNRIAFKDEIGVIMLELMPPEVLGRSSWTVFDNARDVTADIPGIRISAEPFEGGPPVGRPIQIQLESRYYDKLLVSTKKLSDYIASLDGVLDVSDSTPLPGIEWEMRVDRPLAAQMGASIADVGRSVQLLTTGVLIGEYRPDDADEEVEIRVRYPADNRGLNALDDLRVNTAKGAVPISSFVTRRAKQKTGNISRIDAKTVMTIEADVKAGVLAADMVEIIDEWSAEHITDKDVAVVFRGANEETNKSSSFLSVAFSLALFLMFVLLVTQFNSFYQALLILSSVVMSIAGVLLGLLLTGATFSVILTGVGIVALAGIVVNNNIVLIDTYNELRRTRPDLSRTDAAVSACAQRLRPVFLTTSTTVLGLLPLAMGASVDLIGRTVLIDGVVASYFVPLASSIVSGLIFSTVLTLVVTPVMLVLPAHVKVLFAGKFGGQWRDFKSRIPALR